MPIPGNIDKSTINEQVTRILNSPLFHSSSILSDFLYFIVTETLKGNEQNIKEYVIATEVLKRNPDFNPQLDAVVRIHASRLRKSLEDYYQEEGANDPIKITVPKGRYIPDFQNNNSRVVVKLKGKKEITNNTASKPAIAVLPFSLYPENQRLDIISSALVQDLNIELTRFPEIAVISNISSMIASKNNNLLNDAAYSLGADYVITGTCTPEGDNARIRVGLNSISNHRLLWADSFLISSFEGNEITGYREIISKVIAVTCGFFGLISRDLLKGSEPEDYDYFYALYWYNRYHQSFTQQSMVEALKAIETGLEKNPANALLTALKSELYLNIHMVSAPGNDDFFREGTRLAHRAIELDYNCQLGWQTLWWSDLFNHDAKSFTEHANILLSINPCNFVHTGTAGFGFICAGNYEKGIELLSEAIQMNPYYPWFYNLSLSWYYLHENDLEDALRWAKMVNRPEFVMDPLMRACILGLLDRKELARKAADELLKLSPDFVALGSKIITAFLLDDKLINSMIEGLKIAGIELAV